MNQRLEDAYEWILYLIPHEHKAEMSLVRSARLDSFVLVLDTTKCPVHVVLPNWISQSLPVLVNTKQKLAYRGPKCLVTMSAIELPQELARRLQKNAQKRIDL